MWDSFDFDATSLADTGSSFADVGVTDFADVDYGTFDFSTYGDTTDFGVVSTDFGFDTEFPISIDDSSSQLLDGVGDGGTSWWDGFGDTFGDVWDTAKDVGKQLLTKEGLDAVGNLIRDGKTATRNVSDAAKRLQQAPKQISAINGAQSRANQPLLSGASSLQGGSISPTMIALGVGGVALLFMMSRK